MPVKQLEVAWFVGLFLKVADIGDGQGVAARLDLEHVQAAQSILDKIREQLAHLLWVVAGGEVALIKSRAVLKIDQLGIVTE